MKNTFKEIVKSIDREEDIVLPKTIFGEIIYIINSYNYLRKFSGEKRFKELILLDRQISMYLLSRKKN